MAAERWQRPQIEATRGEHGPSHEENGCQVGHIPHQPRRFGGSAALKGAVMQGASHRVCRRCHCCRIPCLPDACGVPAAPGLAQVLWVLQNKPSPCTRLGASQDGFPGPVDQAVGSINTGLAGTPKPRKTSGVAARAQRTRSWRVRPTSSGVSVTRRRRNYVIELASLKFPEQLRPSVVASEIILGAMKKGIHFSQFQ